jgi:hypothetical protein
MKIPDQIIGQWCAEAQSKCVGVVPQARYVVERALDVEAHHILARKVAGLEMRLAMGDAAARIVGELAALVPVPDIVEATETGASMIAYFKKKLEGAA